MSAKREHENTSASTADDKEAKKPKLLGKDEDWKKRPLVLVTGGSRGIGKASVKLLISKGYDVAINYHSNKQAAYDVINEWFDSSPSDLFSNQKVDVFQADVSQEAEVKLMFQKIHSYFGRNPNRLVNNAGILGDWENGTDILTMNSNDLHAIFATNLYGAFYCCQEFVKRYEAGGKDYGTGAIVNVSSGAAHIGKPLFYAMSKGALNSMMAGLSKSLPSKGIRINNVSPGMTVTDMINHSGMLESALPNIPMG